ncbi:MAG TPA: DUF418 domain-containing protein [Chryseolinea sp.]|nr:DUF418 domain-containing protein [Chryseolinea sp.]HPM29699.1 DUF418 domain-containing protein [Chryseolinea sp.]
MTTAAPTSQSERIITLDVLRGIAILGILLMNIPSFSLSGVVGSNPSVLNEFGTISYYIWYAVDWFFDGTQRALFSLLFGAGIVLFISRQEKKSNGLEPADYFFRRQLWLMFFSLVDVYILLWNGDILMDYAIYGMMMFVFRNQTPKTLIIAACISILFMTAKENREFFKQKQIFERGEVVAAIDTTVTKLTSKQKNDLEEMTSFKKRMTTESRLKRMKEEHEKVRGNYESVYEYRTGKYIENIVEYTYFSVWDVLTFMLLGMAFFKLGIVTGSAPMKVYWWLCIGGLGIGLTLSYFRIQFRIDNQFDWFKYIKNVPFSFYELSRVPRALGILGLIMLLYKSNWFNGIFSLFRPVGQMAFTNYLTQSLICSLVFNGFALGLYGHLQRYEVYLIVLGIWIFQIIFCNIWMRYFLYGPFEWVWRSLTYWKRQAFIRAS